MNLKQVAILGSAALMLGLIGCGKEESSGSSASDQPKVFKLTSKSDAARLAIDGGKLVRQIIWENLSGIDIYPHNDENDGLDPSNVGMINSRTYDTSTDYWKALFDIKDQTSADWAPLIDRENLKYVWGSDLLPEAKAGELLPENNAWIMVSGLSESNTPANMPFLISRNVRIDSFFPTEGSHDMRQKDIPILIDGEYAVVVYKDGQAKVLEAEAAALDRFIQLKEFFRSEPITVPEGMTLRYLKP